MADCTIERNEEYLIRGDRVMILLPNESGSIILPDSSTFTSQRGTICALGGDANLEPGFEIGSDVLFRKYGGTLVDRKAYDENDRDAKRVYEHFVIINTTDLVAAISTKDKPASAEDIEKINRQAQASPINE